MCVMSEASKHTDFTKWKCSTKFFVFGFFVDLVFVFVDNMKCEYIEIYLRNYFQNRN